MVHCRMPTATVTSKGQVTIPIEVREKLGIHPGTRVQFLPRADGSFEFLAISGSISALSGIIAWIGPPVTIEQMNEAIADSAAETLR